MEKVLEEWKAEKALKVEDNNSHASLKKDAAATAATAAISDIDAVTNAAEFKPLDLN